MLVDLIIKNGKVLDGTGTEPVKADVAIKNGRICDIGQIGPIENTPTLDAVGCYVTPGFIDCHSHSDFTLFVDPRALSSITQGVTTEILGNCGHGCIPVSNPEQVTSNIFGYKKNYDIPWRTTTEYLDSLEKVNPAINVATLVPNGNLRLAAVESLDRPSSPEELKKIKKLLIRSLQEGAIGYSTGLEYATEANCSEEEITEL